MIVTDINKQYTVITEQDNNCPGDTTARRRRTDQHPADTAHVIPFPAEPALKLRPATETSGPQIFSLPLRKARPIMQVLHACNEPSGTITITASRLISGICNFPKKPVTMYRNCWHCGH